MKIETAMEAVKEASKQAEKKTLVVKEFKNLDYVRQGDIYIGLLDELPKNCHLVDEPNRQLAPGNSPGSRHTVGRGWENCKVYELNKPTVLDGPILVTGEEGLEIEHPQHGNVDISCKAVVPITYQRLHAEELRRLRD